MWLPYLLGQQAPDPNIWTQLGVAAGIVALSVWFILLQEKRHSKEVERLDGEIETLRQELRDERAQNRELAKSQLELAERALPSLNETARVVAEASDELKRSRRR